MPLTRTDMAQVASEFVSALNDADWDRVRTLIAPDLSYAENTTGRRAESADAYLEIAKGTKAAFPDFTVTIEATATNNDTVAQRIVWEGTHTGPLNTPVGPIPPSGNHVRVVSSAWSRFEGDTIREIHFHIDALSLREQMAAPTG